MAVEWGMAQNTTMPKYHSRLLIPQNPQRFHAVTVAERVHMDGWRHETNATHASDRPYPLDWVSGLSGMPGHRGRKLFKRKTNPGGTNPKQMMCFSKIDKLSSHLQNKLWAR